MPKRPRSRRSLQLGNRRPRRCRLLPWCSETIPGPDPFLGAGPVRSPSAGAILEAAKELFVTKGYSATSVADIVDRAGTSVGLPYYTSAARKDLHRDLGRVPAGPGGPYPLRRSSGSPPGRQRPGRTPGRRAGLSRRSLGRPRYPTDDPCVGQAGRLQKRSSAWPTSVTCDRTRKLLAELGPERARIASVWPRRRWRHVRRVRLVRVGRRGAARDRYQPGVPGRHVHQPPLSTMTRAIGIELYSVCP